MLAKLNVPAVPVTGGEDGFEPAGGNAELVTDGTVGGVVSTLKWQSGASAEVRVPS